MTKEDKHLLLADLCARLPYGVKIHKVLYGATTLNERNIESFRKGFDDMLIPYLRPMSSMTDEEKENLNLIVDEFGNKWMNSKSPLDKWKAAFWEYSEATNYLNSIHIDYHTDDEGKTMIEKGLALEAPDGMYEKGEQQ